MLSPAVRCAAPIAIDARVLTHECCAGTVVLKGGKMSSRKGTVIMFRQLVELLDKCARSLYFQLA